MPTIHDFGGYRIYIYFDDHNPPHFHVVAKDEEVVIDIRTLEVIEGSMGRKRLRTALEWAGDNRETLIAKWNELTGE